MYHQLLISLSDIKMPAKKKSDRSEDVAVPPDGGYGWIVVIGATLTHLLLVGMARSLGMIYEDLRDRFHGSASATAWVAAIFNTCRSLIAPICGLMCKRWSCRIVAMLGGLVMALGLVTSAFATSLYYLYVTFAITGFGGAMVFTPAYVMVGNYFDKNKGKAMGLATTGSGLGSIILAPTVTALLNTYAFFGTMIVLGAVQLNNCVAGSLYRPVAASNKRTTGGEVFVKDIGDEEKLSPDLLDKGNRNVNNVSVHVADKHDIKTGKDTILKEWALDEINKDLSVTGKPCSCCPMKSDSLFCNRTFYLYGYLVMSMQVCIQSYLIFLPGYALEHGADSTGASLALSVFGFVDMIGRFAFGFVFDLAWVSTRRRDFYCLVSGMFGLTAMSLTFVQSFVGVCVATVFVALFEGATHSQRATVLSDFVPQKQMPTAVGVIIFCQGVGNIWGPPFAGYLRDVTGTNAYGFIFCGSVMFSASVLFFLENVLRRNCRRS